MKCDFPLVHKLAKPLLDGKGGLIYSIPLACGRCYNCRQNRANGWSFRLAQELKRSDTAYFVTLTYDAEHLPYSEKVYPTLEKTDVQKFLKRLRKEEEESPYGIDDLQRQKYQLEARGNKKIKYFAVGEYGSKRHRPHYHIILFNCYNRESIQKAWTLGGKPLGGVHITECNINTIDYTVKYICKPSKAYKYLYEGTDRQKEFNIQSKGLGDNYVTPSIHLYHNEDLEKHYLMTDRNYKIPIPRYYRNKLYDMLQQKRLIVHIKEAMEKKQVEREYLLKRQGIDPGEQAVKGIYKRQNKNQKLDTRNVD